MKLIFGSWKPKQQKQINEMGCGLKFHLTGSNIYKILSTLGDVDDRFFQFSYTDMLLMRDGSHPWLKGVSDEELVEITKSLKDIKIADNWARLKTINMCVR